MVTFVQRLYGNFESIDLENAQVSETKCSTWYNRLLRYVKQNTQLMNPQLDTIDYLSIKKQAQREKDMKIGTVDLNT